MGCKQAHARVAKRGRDGGCNGYSVSCYTGGLLFVSRRLVSDWSWSYSWVVYQIPYPPVRDVCAASVQYRSSRGNVCLMYSVYWSSCFTENIPDRSRHTDNLDAVPAGMRWCAGLVLYLIQETCAWSCRSNGAHAATWARSYRSCRSYRSVIYLALEDLDQMVFWSDECTVFFLEWVVGAVLLRCVITPHLFFFLFFFCFSSSSSGLIKT